MSEAEWRLADYYQPVGEEEEFPEYIIRSEGELRHHLEAVLNGPARIVELYSPHADFLRIGIGGPYAGSAWIQLPTIKMLIAPKQLTSKPVVFEIQGQPCTLQPDELHRPETIINLACHFFAHASLPPDLIWRDAS